MWIHVQVRRGTQRGKSQLEEIMWIPTTVEP